MKLFTLLMVAFAFCISTTFAVNDPICITVVFFDINGSAVDNSDLFIVSVKTTEISILRGLRGWPLLAIYIIRGPIGTRNSSRFFGHEEFGISRSGVNGQDVYIGQYDKGPGQIEGIQFTLFESTFQNNVTVPDPSAVRVVEETESAVLISLNKMSPFYDSAQARSAVLPFSITDICLP